MLENNLCNNLSDNIWDEILNSSNQLKYINLIKQYKIYNYWNENIQTKYMSSII